MEALLQVRDLAARFHSGHCSEVLVVRGVSFDLHRGEVIGLLGESGCGKTTTALALLRLLPPDGCVVSGSVRFRGRDLLNCSEEELQKIRGAEISMISQEPGIALNPVLPVGMQIAEVIRAHRQLNRKQRRAEAELLLAEVGLSDTARTYAAYPHQLSGGQKQRVMIAQALACRPALVIADEPTAALDTTVQTKILDLLKELKKRLQLAFLLISHNPATLVGLADRLMVMYAGRIVEEGDTSQVLSSPLHPYTRSLLASMPFPPFHGGLAGKKQLPTIADNPPDPAHLPEGCSFAPRCPERMATCTVREPQTVQTENTRRVECFVYGG